MKILHTADIHLKEFEDPRWQALEQLIALGKKEAIDVLVIAGDLFDGRQEAQELYPHLNQLFQETSFFTLIIRGNHDANAYPEGVYLGEQVKLIEDPSEPVKLKQVAFWGIPYRDMDEIKLLQMLSDLARKVDPQNTNILIFHGELLDLAGFGDAYGDEGRKHYMPVHLANFQNLPWQYVLAGHFHTHFHLMEIETEKYFVYPGTPVSVSRKEVGPRFVNLFQVGSAPVMQQVHNFYYHPLKFHLNPLEDSLPLKKWQAEIRQVPNYGEILISLSGYFNSNKWGMTESELVARVKDMLAERGELIEKNIRDIGEILEKDLFQQFRARLEDKTFPANKKQAILELGLKAMMEAM